MHPKQAKVDLAKNITAQYHGKAEADKQAEEFDRAFKDKGFPQDIKLQELTLGPKATILDVLVDGAKILASRGEAKRKIQEGAVEVNGSKITDINLTIEAGKEHRIRVGKKFARVILKKS